MCLAGHGDGDGYVGAPFWDGRSHDRLASWCRSSARKVFFMKVFLIRIMRTVVMVVKKAL